MYCKKKFLNQGANYPSDAADVLCGVALILLQLHFCVFMYFLAIYFFHINPLQSKEVDKLKNDREFLISRSFLSCVQMKSCIHNLDGIAGEGYRPQRQNHNLRVLQRKRGAHLCAQLKIPVQGL